jgi:hypothetical protein
MKTFRHARTQRSKSQVTRLNEPIVQCQRALLLCSLPFLTTCVSVSKHITVLLLLQVCQVLKNNFLMFKIICIEQLCR